MSTLWQTSNTTEIYNGTEIDTALDLKANLAWGNTFTGEQISSDWITSAKRIRLSWFGEWIASLESTGGMYINAGWDNSGNEDITFQTATTNRMIIKNTTGNVWIWTISPWAKLDIEPWTDRAIQITSGATTQWSLVIDSNSLSSWNWLWVKTTSTNFVWTAFSWSAWLWTFYVANTSATWTALSAIQDGTWTALKIVNNNTGNWLFIDQNWNWIALNIDSESTDQRALQIVHQSTTWRWLFIEWQALTSWYNFFSYVTSAFTGTANNFQSTNASSTGHLVHINNAWTWNALRIAWAWATIEIVDVTAPSTTTNKLYAVWGNLFWNGIQLN